MNHQDAVSGELVTKYLAGRLSDDVAAGFEEHFVACAVCQQRLEIESAMREGFRHADRLGQIAGHQRRAPPSWPLRTAAASALLAVGAVIALSIPEPQRELSADRAKLTAAAVGTPAAARVFRFEALRSGAERFDVEVDAAVKPETWLFDVEIPRRCADGTAEPLCADDSPPSVPVAARFELRALATPDGREVLRISDQSPLTSGALVFSVPSASLPRGSYELVVQGLDGSTWREVSRYSLAVR